MMSFLLNLVPVATLNVTAVPPAPTTASKRGRTSSSRALNSGQPVCCLAQGLQEGRERRLVRHEHLDLVRHLDLLLLGRKLLGAAHPDDRGHGYSSLRSPRRRGRVRSEDAGARPPSRSDRPSPVRWAACWRAAPAADSSTTGRGCSAGSARLRARRTCAPCRTHSMTSTNSGRSTRSGVDARSPTRPPGRSLRWRTSGRPARGRLALSASHASSRCSISALRLARGAAAPRPARLTSRRRSARTPSSVSSPVSS